MTNIVPFHFENNPVRVLDIDGEPWFVGNDVAAVLGYGNPRDALGRNCKRAQNVGASGIPTPADIDPQTKIIPEADVYRLIIRSKRPEAERFEQMVMEEILPNIRKTGRYEAEPAAQMTEDQMIAHSMTVLIGRVEALKVENHNKDVLIGQMQPKVEEYDAYLDTEGVVPIRDFCNKHQVKVRHPGWALRDRGMLHKKRTLATQKGIKSGVIKNIVDRNSFEYIDARGNAVEAQSAMVVKQKEDDLLRMIVTDFGKTAFRNEVAFARAVNALSPKGGAA